MKELKFKTNINCGGCIEKVSRSLNETVGVGAWNVDITHPGKILTVKGSDEKKVINAVVKSGFRAEKV